jgi:hypothetical protein
LYCCPAVFLSTVCTGIEFLCVILLPVSVRRPPLLLIGYIVLPVCIPRLSSCSFPLCFLQPIVSSVQPYVDYVLDTLVLILYCLPSHRVLSTLFIFLTLLIKSDRHRQMRRAPLFFLSHNRDSSYIIVPLHPPFFFRFSSTCSPSLIVCIPVPSAVFHCPFSRPFSGSYRLDLFPGRLT